jgi:hypothetical protein
VTTETLTLSDFLLARYAEDVREIEEGVRLKLAGRRWGKTLLTRRRLDVEGKRKIVELHGQEMSWMDSPTGTPRPICMLCGTDDVTYPCRTLRALALPFVDHPDYRQEWAL